MQAVIQRDIPMDYGIWKTVSPECRDLIKAMLTRDPAQRISAADAMHHAWFRSFGIGAPVQELMLGTLSWPSSKRLPPSIHAP